MKFYSAKKLTGRRQFVVSAGAILAACGGGVEVGTGGTGNSPPAAQPPTAGTQPVTASGPITGFGSVIVNGIKFDDTSATVADQRGQSVAKDALRLGMFVTISGQLQSDGVTAVASNVQVRSELKGSISAIDLANNKLTVLGLTIMINGNTSYDDVANLAALKVNDVIEVYGLRDPQSQLITATRIERNSSIVSVPFVVGKVNALDATNKTITLGTADRSVLVGYAGATISPAGTALAVGQSLYIDVDSASANASPLRALTVTVLTPVTLPSSGRLEVEGVISEFQSLSAFKVAGQLIDASSAVFSQGAATDLKNGAIASVKGTVDNGVLKATKIEVRVSGSSSSGSSSSSSSTSTSSTSSSSSSSGGDNGGGNANRFELNGSITAFTSISNFVVRNTVVDASTALFSEGSAALLAVNIKVEMLGTINGNKFVAAIIKAKK